MKFLQLTAAALLLAAQTATAQAPTYEWTNAFESTGSFCDVYSVTTDMDGNSYFTGDFSGRVDLDPSADSLILDEANGNGRLFVAKMSPTGALLWAKQTALYYELSYANGAIYAITGIQDTVDINPGAGTTTLISQGDYDAVVVKFDTAMSTIIWHKVLASTAEEYFVHLNTTADGKVFLAGEFRSDLDVNPSADTLLFSGSGFLGFFLMLDNNGDFLWAKQHIAQISNFAKTSISGNDIYASFRLNGIDTLDGIALASVGNYDAVLAKINATTGAVSWAKSFGEPTVLTRFGYNVLPRANGNITLAFNNRFTGTLDYDPSAAVANFTHSSNLGFVFVTFDSSGNFVSVEGVDATTNNFVEMNHATTDYLGNLYLTGFFRGTVDFAPTSATNNQTTPNPVTGSIFLMRLDNTLAVDFIETSDSGRFFLNGLHLDNRGNIFNYGRSSATTANTAVDFDFTAGTDYVVAAIANNNYGFITKMSQPTFVGVTANEAVAAAKLFPNPAAQLINIENAVVGSQLRVTDALGRVVLQARIDNKNTQIATDVLSNGLYFFQIQQAGSKNSEMHKVIIAK